jgi:hypothetical protein
MSTPKLRGAAWFMLIGGVFGSVTKMPHTPALLLPLPLLGARTKPLLA